MNDEQLTQRMRAASGALLMSDSAQARHLEAIATALGGDEVVAIDSVRPRRRRQILASIVAATVIAPAGLAAASDSAIPGDPLYGVKQLSERVLVLFDADVIARHRVEEIEALDAVGDSDPALVERARFALTELGSDHDLWQRLEASTADRDDEENEHSATPAEVSDDPGDSDDVPAEPDAVIVELPDGSSATITFVDDDILEVAAPTGWTVIEIDGDRAKVGNGTLEIEIELLEDGSARVPELDGSDEDAVSGDDATSQDSKSEAASSSDDRGDESPRSDDDESDDS
ncbi:MAG TPA: hypothetical protein VIW46_13690 [Acidimicrobiia bacterium]|jgi:hypothetical protein